MSLARFHPYLKGKHNFTSCQGDTVRQRPDKPNTIQAQHNTAWRAYHSHSSDMWQAPPQETTDTYDHSTQPSTQGSTSYTRCSARTSSTSSRSIPPAPCATGQQEHWHPNPEQCV